MKTRHGDIAPYITKDGSEIRELMHPAVHGNRNQSFAEAKIPAGASTRLHRHRATEEIYHVTRGRGQMRLGDQILNIVTGDTVCILPGTPHSVTNTGDMELRILCACAPAYDHADTELLEK